jgi:hypothetical protein
MLGPHTFKTTCEPRFAPLIERAIGLVSDIRAHKTVPSTFELPVECNRTCIIAAPAVATDARTMSIATAAPMTILRISCLLARFEQPSVRPSA